MIFVTSLLNTPQTLDSVSLPAFATQKRVSATAAILAASVARSVYYSEAKGDNSDLGVGRTEYEFAPLTGATLALADDAEVIRIRPAGTIAALTVNPPANPRDGQIMSLQMTQIITALTMTGLNSQTIAGALTAGTANGFASWRYETSTNTWNRIG